MYEHMLIFQLVDDLLDFTATDSEMGKPTAADLSLGLATAPVLYAAHEVRLMVANCPLICMVLVFVVIDVLVPRTICSYNATVLSQGRC